jgi:hypothetical protein
MKRPWGDKKCMQQVNQKIWKDEITWDDIKMYLKENGCEGVDWIHLAHDRVQCRAIVNAVMNFGFHRKEEFID